MNNARFQALCLTFIGLVCILSSCGPKAKQADAMVTIFGQAAGVVLEYNTPLDKSSINKETFQVKGKSIMSVFVSNSNQFKNDNGKDSDQGDGRYVIILLNQPTNASEADDLKAILERELKKEVTFEIYGPSKGEDPDTKYPDLEDHINFDVEINDKF